jgi:tetratricopeptide (TPR) repeat protein
MKLFRLTLALAPALCASAANASNPVSLQGWRQYSGPDFTIISQMSEADTAAWTGRINQFIHAMQGRLPGDPRVLGPFNLVLFENNADYWASAPILKNGSPLPNVAAYGRAGGWGAIAAACALGSDEQTQRILFGECINWLLSSDHRYRPRALRQGLNEVYGAYVIENGVEVFGRPIRGGTSRLQRAVRNSLNNAETFLRVEDLLAVKDVSEVADKHGVPMFGLESWGFAHFLLFSTDMAKQHAMDRLLAAFSHHRDPHDALREAFGDGADTLNTRFRNYISGGDFYEVSAPIEPAPLAGRIMPANPATVASILGRLEASTGHLDMARSHAEEAIRLAPNDPRPREALALVDYLSHNPAAAAADCREAIRLNTRDGWTWFEASEEVGRAGQPDPNPEALVQLTADQARDAINAAEKAILPCRGLEAAYSRVAALMPLASQVTEDDGKFLAMGRILFPNNGWIEIGHAQWAHRVHEDALALKIVGDVLSRAASLSPEEVRRAKDLQGELTAGRG